LYKIVGGRLARFERLSAETIVEDEGRSF